MIEYEPVFGAFAIPQPELLTGSPLPPLLLLDPPLLLVLDPPLLLLDPPLLLLDPPPLLLDPPPLLLDPPPLLLDPPPLLLDPPPLVLDPPPLLLDPLFPWSVGASVACPRPQAARRRTEPSARELDALRQTEQFTRFLCRAGSRGRLQGAHVSRWSGQRKGLAPRSANA